MDVNELKVIISEIISEAKKKDIKAKKMEQAGGTAKNAYGFFDEALDFSTPLGGYNLYKSQGAVNWGPNTGPGQHIDQNFANPNTRLELKEGQEEAIRSIVREVIEYGLIPSDSAWQTMLESKRPEIFESAWDEALHEMNYHWGCSGNVPVAGPKKTGYGPVGGEEKEEGKARKPKPSSKNGRPA